MRTRLLACAIAALLPTAGWAQRPASPLFGSAPPPAAQEDAGAALTLLPAPALSPAAFPQRAVAVRRSFWYTAGGLVVGAGVGYFTSQVMRSDWDESVGSEFRDYRVRLSIAGAVLGGIGGMLFGQRAPEPVVAGAGAAPLAPGRSADRPIVAEDIRASGAQTAMQLVQSLRPLWLQTRGTKRTEELGQLTGDSRAPTVVPGQTTIVVYLNNARMGGVEQLRQIPITTVAQIEFLDPAAATYRWGRGHEHGAILVTAQ